MNHVKIICNVNEYSRECKAKVYKYYLCSNHYAYILLALCKKHISYINVNHNYPNVVEISEERYIHLFGNEKLKVIS